MFILVTVLIGVFLLGFMIGHVTNQDKDQLSSSSLKAAYREEWNRRFEGRANLWD